MPMAYETTVKLTRDNILLKVSESQIFQYYLGYNPEIGKRYVNPLRIDKKPDCEFKYSSGRLRFVDYASGYYEDCFGVVQTIHRCNYPQALEQVAKDFGLYGYSKNKIIITPIMQSNEITKEKERTRFRIKFRKWNKIDADYWKPYCITREILEYFNVRPVHAVWKNNEELPFYIYTDNDPCYAYIFPDNTVKLYFPLRKEAKFRNNSNYIQGWEQLPPNGEVCFITKSKKDVMCMFAFGIPAIAPPAENYPIKAEDINDLKRRFKYIFILYDWDKAGIRGAMKIHREYGLPFMFFTCSGKGVKVKRDFGTKDFSDMVKKYGYQEIIDIISYVDALIMFEEEYNFNQLNEEEIPF